MKMFTQSMFLASMLALPIAQAADEEDHSAHHPGAGQEQADPAADDKAAGMKMDKMQKKMKKMQDLMAKIQSTDDPKERQKLMEEHMESMRDGMKMMRGMGGKPKGEHPAEGGGEKDTDKGGMMGGMMMKKHQMMEDRLDAMQKMMEQILEHEAAEQDMEHGK